MKYPINILDKNDFKVIKVIKVIGPYWNLFTGYIIYCRPFTNSYNSETTDLLDVEILNGLKMQFPDSKLILSKSILFKGEFENIKRVYSCGHKIDFTINFMPSITQEMLNEISGKELHSYSLELAMYLMIGSSDEKINEIQRFSIAYISFEQYNEFEKLVQTLIPEMQ